MKIFFSYPHDANAPLVERIKADLEARGHEVWFDADQIKSGDDWRNAITRGILDSQQVVAFLSKHAVRDPGVCLNEIAIALADKGEAMVTVLVEPESEVSAPVSITHIQWLKMEDWQSRAQDDGWYRTQLDRLIDAIEHPTHAGRNQELETLKLALDPMSFYAEIAPHIPGFTGRRWIIDRYTTWLTDEPNSRVLRIEGGPGLGKTAVASYLAHSTKSGVLAVHLCQYNKGESRNPLRLVRTLAYQLATRLPDYRARLIKSVAIQRPEMMQGKDPASLWSELISAPLAGVGKGTIDRQRLAIIIDGLDEATVEGRNTVVELLATEINQLPKWIGVVLTGRPDPELTQRLARYQPLVLRDDDPQNIADLKVYVDDWLNQEVKAGKLTVPQAKAASETLLARSQGAFLYLSQARIAVAENMLDLTQPTLFPSGLTEIYQRFFERRFPDAGNNEGSYKTKVRPLLELVLASPEPLPVSIAREVLKWGPYDGPEVIQSLGSLLKRTKGGLGTEDEETLAPFHNSVREWLQDTDAAGDFHVSAEDARMPLTIAVWRRYLESEEKDVYGWQVLPDLLPLLSNAQRETLLGVPAWDTSQVLYRLTDSLAPKLRFQAAAALWAVLVRYNESLIETDPENAKLARNLAFVCRNWGRGLRTIGKSTNATEAYRRYVAIVEKLSERFPEHVEYAKELGAAHGEVGRFMVDLGRGDSAVRSFEKSLAVIKALATKFPDDTELTQLLCDLYHRFSRELSRLGRHGLSLEFIQDGLFLAETLSAIEPSNPHYIEVLLNLVRDLAFNCVYRNKRRDDSEGAFARAEALSERLKECSAPATNGNSSEKVDLGEEAAVYLAYGRQLSTEKARTAVAYLQTKIANQELEYSKATDSVNLALTLSRSRLTYARVLDSLGSATEARKSRTQASELLEQIHEMDREDARPIKELEEVYAHLLEESGSQGLYNAAFEYSSKRLNLLEVLVARDPDNIQNAKMLARACIDSGDSLFKLNAIERAVSYYQRGFAIRSRLLHRDGFDDTEIWQLSSTKLGDEFRKNGRYHEALNCYEDSKNIFQLLVEREPENKEFLNALLFSYNKLGDLQSRLDNTRGALGLYRQGLQIAERLAADAPEDTNYAFRLESSYDKLGIIQSELGNSQVALGWYEKSMRIAERLAANAPEDTNYALGLRNKLVKLGDIQAELGNSQAALTWYEKGIGITERLAAKAQKVGDPNLSGFCDALGDLQSKIGNFQTALDWYEKGLGIIVKLQAAGTPKNNYKDYSDYLITYYWKLGEMQLNLGNARAALALYQQRLTIVERQAELAPEDLHLSGDLALSVNLVGHALASLGRTDEALGYYQQALKIREALTDRSPENGRFARGLSISFDLLGDTLASLGRMDEALSYYHRGLNILEGLASRAPEHVRLTRDLWDRFINLGDKLTGLGRTDDALSYYQRSLTIGEALVARAPENAKFARDLSISYDRLGNTLNTLGRLDEAMDYYRRSLAIREDFATRAPESAESAIDLGKSLAAVARIQGEFGDFGEMRSGLARAQAIAEAFSNRPLLGWLLGQAGWASAALGDFANARDRFDQALALAREAGNVVGTAWRQAGLAEVEWLEYRDYEAAALVEQVLASARSTQDPDLLANALLILGRARHALGDIAAAADAYVEALDLGVLDTVGESATLLAALRREQGSVDESDTLLNRALADCEERLGKSPKRHSPRYLKSMCLLARGHVGEGMHSLAVAVDGCSAAGVIRRALRHLDLIERTLPETSDIAMGRAMLIQAGKLRE